MQDTLTDRIYRSIKWLEESQDDKFYVEKMADISCLSPYHFSRVFYSMTGMSPALYCRRRQLTKSIPLIQETTTPLIQIALEFGYETQESFTRAFKKMFRVNPGEVRKKEINLSPYLQDVMSLDALQHIKSNLTLKPDYRQHKEKRIIGVAGIIDFDGIWQANKIWKKFLQIETSKPYDISYGVCQGVMQHKTLEAQIKYLAGVECDGSKNFLEGVTIKEGNYAVFEHSGRLEDIENALKYIWQIWVPKSGLNLENFPDFEIYDDSFCQEKLTGKIQIWIPVEIS